MDVSAVLCEVYGRIPPLLGEAVDGLTPAQLCQRPTADANPIGWLVWHLTRVEDHHGADLLGEEQQWVSGGWPERFGLEADPHNTGYGHSPSDVARVAPTSAQTCLDYHAAVHARLETFLRGLSSIELDRVVDRNWDPPVTLGVRLVSIVDDALQHAGQACFVRGLLGL